MTDKLKNYWVSWYHEEKFSPFEIHSPWWISGGGEGLYDNDKIEYSICSAIKATDEMDAQRKIYHSYDTIPEKITFRFHEEQSHDWKPFSKRFPKADGMKWD